MLARVCSALLVAFLPVLARGEATALTEATFDKSVFEEGKNGAFVKFFAPWCGHCKAMKPAWDQLAGEYEGSSVLVADVDCTVEKDLCEKYEVRGYPTVKYFTAETGKDGESYNGSRNLEDLQAFVQENLELKCSIASMTEGCTEKEVKYFEKMQGKGADEWQKQLDRLNKMKGDSMAKELKQWIAQRISILTQMTAKDEI
mmetsp:Transcript_3337/g.12086  ORF Transcript_3337/g.12086 Transcript_3337/m.12086 type:complete len:201 (+) Transcript_3337:60-662(+)